MGYSCRQWGDKDPSVFNMSITEVFHGEYQVTNGLGALRAPKIMKNHWKKFIVEKDFDFIATSGLNAVRIPVGWWTARDLTPPKPYVGGSLHYLDKAFLWAKKRHLKVILDLHCAPGSQNGYEHSSTRDGSLEWGQTEETIQETLRVIEFFTTRYAKNPSFYAVGLINEPRAPGVTLSALAKYYKAGYEVVRKHAPYAFVIFSTRLDGDPKEIFPITTGMKGVVIDVHYYNQFSPIFNNMNSQQNIDFIKTNRSSELQAMTTSNGPLTFVGEWVAEWEVKGASKEDYKRYAKVQQEVFGRDGGGLVVANQMSPSRWETFRLWRIDENNFRLRVYNKQFLGLDSTGINLVAVTNISKEASIFNIVKEYVSDDPTRQPIRVRIKAPNDKFLQATTEDLVTADAQGDGPWANDDPSVFSMMITKRLTGEYQLTNGYGPNKAPQIMEDHWSTYIVEADFEIIAQNGLNAVRIPVGWWTAFDPTLPPPYVGGSRQYLDNAFFDKH
ncbi:probable glucan 1,3-beta-glucosidase A [Tanacetum coccineum]